MGEQDVVGQQPDHINMSEDMSEMDEIIYSSQTRTMLMPSSLGH